MRPDLPILPVTEALPRLLAALGEGNAAVLVAPPGAGKTTLVPLALLGEDWRGDGRILLLEPRRLAARAAARRMAQLLGEEPGGQVGYAMRMESRVGPRTRILVVTEGVLARMILDDPELTGVAAVLFDEFHERSLDGDFGLALALDVQGALRPDLRLLVMSATIDGARVARLMGDAPVVTSEGRSFPVELRHEERGADEKIEDAMARAIRGALMAEEGSILAFLPGQREIERTAERLEGRIPANADIVPLYGNLDGRAQDAAIRPAPEGRRKIVLATSIAETSITIDGVRVVVDSGLSRLPKYEPATGLTRLETVRASRASAEQRAGRAGRTQAGIAIRLWRAEQTAALPAFTPPEILEADLSGLVLDAAAFGVADVASLAFLDPPPAPALAEASALLRDLGAIDADGRLTDTGRAMRNLALPVRLAHMVAEAAQDSAAQAAAELAVLLTERGLGGTGADLDHRLTGFRRDRSPRAESARALARRLAKAAAAPWYESAAPHPYPLPVKDGERGASTLQPPSNAAPDSTPSSELPAAIPSTPATPSPRLSRGEGKGEGQREARYGKHDADAPSSAPHPTISPSPLTPPFKGEGDLASRPASNLSATETGHGRTASPSPLKGGVRGGGVEAYNVSGKSPATTDATSAGRLLLHAWPDRVAKARGAPGRYVLANGRGAMLEETDALAKSAFLVVADVTGKAQNARIVAAAAISEDDIRAVLSGRFERRIETAFDAATKTVRVREKISLGAIALSERMLPAPSGADADRAILDAVRAHGLALLPWDKASETLRRRLAWLHKGLGPPWPDMSDAALTEALDDWLLPFLSGEASLARIRPAALQDGLMSRVPHELQRKVADLAPTHFRAPTGNNLPIRYEDEGPVLAVRVQELFGLDTHPSIASGRVPLTLELLSPAHRPIQTTRDLPGFWRGSWSEVRADMRGRYPRHVWPEDPRAAQATARAKPRGT